MKDIKKKTVEVRTSTVRVYKNVTELLNGAALAAVSGYAVYQALQHDGYWYKGLLFAGVLIALQAFVLLARFFNKEV